MRVLYIPEDNEGGVSAQLQGEALNRGGGGGGQQPTHLTRPGEGHHGYLTDIGTDLLEASPVFTPQNIMLGGISWEGVEGSESPYTYLGVLGESPTYLPGDVWAHAPPPNLGCWVSALPIYLGVLCESPTHLPGSIWARAQPTNLGMLGKCPAHLPESAGWLLCPLTWVG